MSFSHPARLGALAGSMSRSVRGAASTFTQIVSEQVGMSVSHVELADRAMLDRCFADFNDCCDGRLCGVMQRLRTAEGASVQAMLVLPERGGLALVRRMLGLRGEGCALSELEQDALAEVGSIVINACTGVLAGSFGWDIEASVPNVTVSSPDRPFCDGESLNNALVTHLRMHLSGLRVEGLVLLELSGIEDSMLSGQRRLHA
jgi:chemotaxis protein CheY-P-specific phosphatase CheC